MMKARSSMVSPMVPIADPERFGCLFVETQGDILRYILVLVRDIYYAHEILQDTAVDLWRKFDQYDPVYPFAAWACRFAFRRVLKHRGQRSDGSSAEHRSLTQIAAEQAEVDGILEQRERL